MMLRRRWVRYRARNRIAYARALSRILGWIVCPRCYGMVEGPLSRHLRSCPPPWL